MTTLGTIEEARAYLAAHPEVEQIDAIYPDLCNLWRGKRFDRGDLAKLYESGMPVPGAVFLIDVTGQTSDPLGRGYSDGDPDHLALPVAGTLIPVPWSPRPRAQVLLSIHELDRRPYDASPRHVLARVAARLAELGVTARIAAELEFYLIDRRRDENGLPQPPVLPATGQRAQSRQVFAMADLDAYGPFLDAVMQACAAQGIPANVASSEYAPGQMEINLRHVDDAVLAADHAVLLQRAITSVARSFEFDATFMAKPYLQEEGSGLHYHVSLVDAGGRNLFEGGGDGVSDMLRHAIGGMGALLKESMAIFAPNVNSYRRLTQSLFAASAFSWADNNRMTSVRLPVGRGEARRFEHRVAGADANPYLTLAAVLAGVHHGIVNRIEPGPPQQGDRRPEPGDIPSDWAGALDAMAAGSILRDYLGSDYVDLYVATKRGEMERFFGTPTRLEYDWYLGAR